MGGPRMGRRGPIPRVRTTLALRGFVWVTASAKTPIWQRRSRRACFSYQARDGHREGALPAHHGGWGARATRRNSRRSLRRNSVHKCPKMAPRGPILPFVYTIAIPRPPTTQARVATVYTNAPKRRREPVFADLCTLLRHHGRSRDRAGPQVDRDSNCSAWMWGSLVP